MRCSHPLMAFYTIDPVTGRKNLRHFKSIDTADGKAIYELHDQERTIMIPCGQCLACRMRYSNDWANRIYLEACTYPRDRNWFLTLTYDEDHLPYGSGERPTLIKDEISKFMKALRQRWAEDETQTEGIRFFGCGEYGGKTQRPHYHIILLNCLIKKEDLKVYKTEAGHVLWNVPKITHIWGKGHVVVAECNWETCAYTSRYMLKKHKGQDADYYEKLGIYPEHTRMSRRPGIGADYLDDNWEQIWSRDHILIKGHQAAVPAAYTRKLGYSDLDREAEIKAKRMHRAQLTAENEANLGAYDRPVWEQLQIEEEAMRQRTALLKRRLEKGILKKKYHLYEGSLI